MDRQPTAIPNALREGLFETLSDMLLLVLYLSAIMVLVSEWSSRPLTMRGWGVPMGIFAVAFFVVRTAIARRASIVASRTKMVRRRWILFAVTGAIVAATSAARMVLRGGGVNQSLLGLTLAAAVMMLVGLIALAHGTSRPNKP